MTTNKTIEEIVHNLNTGYYLGNGGEEAATQAIEALITEARADERKLMDTSQELTNKEKK